MIFTFCDNPIPKSGIHWTPVNLLSHFSIQLRTIFFFLVSNCTFLPQCLESRATYKRIIFQETSFHTSDPTFSEIVVYFEINKGQCIR